jgi:peptide chain release factor subunit 1
MASEPRPLTPDRIASLAAMPRTEAPVVSLYLKGWGPHPERRAVLKNLIREGDAQIESDTGWNDARKKEARQRLERARAIAEGIVERMPAHGRGASAIFVGGGFVEEVALPIDARDRIVIDRSPYASPLSSLIDQYERYGVILVDRQHARIFEVFLGELEGWEELASEPVHPDERVSPGGPKRRFSGAPGGASRGGAPGSVHGRGGAIGTGGYEGMGEKRIERHDQYVVHQHLQMVADRAFRRFRLRPFDRLIIGGTTAMIPLLEDHLHSYLRQKLVAREELPVELARDELRKRILAIEERIEAEKEREALQQVRDNLGKAGLAVAGLDDTLRALFFGQVRTLFVQDGLSLPGRECPECHFLFQRPKDEQERTPTLVECPLCKRATQRVADLIDEAVELAITTGARIEHVNYAKDEVAGMGGMAALLRFK